MTIFYRTDHLSNFMSILGSRSSQQSRAVVLDEKKLRDYKVILLGDTSVGKTTLVCKLVGSEEIAEATIGAIYNRHIVDEQICLNIWDTGGHERYRSMTQQYYHDTDICILAFDLSEPKTFIDIQEYWLPSFVRHCNNFLKIYLVGTKLDKRINSADPSLAAYQKYASTNGLKFFTTTYHEPPLISQLFDDIGTFLVQYENENGISPKKVRGNKKKETFKINDTDDDNEVDEDEIQKKGCGKMCAIM